MTVKYVKPNNEYFISQFFLQNTKVVEDVAKYALITSSEISVDCALDTIEHEHIPVDEVSLKYLKTHINSAMIKDMAIGYITDQLDELKTLLIEKINEAEVVANITKISYKEDNAAISDVEIDLGLSFPTK